MKSKHLFFVLLMCCIAFFSCKKNYARQYEGNYVFTTRIKHESIASPPVDTSIVFHGYIVSDTNSTMIVHFGPGTQDYIQNGGTIHPTVDAKGNITYPRWTSTFSYCSGHIDESGKVNISIGVSYRTLYESNNIAGVRE